MNEEEFEIDNVDVIIEEEECEEDDNIVILEEGSIGIKC